MFTYKWLNNVKIPLNSDDGQFQLSFSEQAQTRLNKLDNLKFISPKSVYSPWNSHNRQFAYFFYKVLFSDTFQVHAL